MPLRATADPGHHHFATDVVYFYMSNGDQRVRCGVTRLALELLEPDLPPTKQGRIRRSSSAAPASSGPPVPNLIETTLSRMVVPSW
jgi:hypothetical protein